MKKILSVKLLIILMFSIFANMSFSNTLKKDVNVERIQAKMREADYLDRDLRKDKKMYIKGDSTPFTGTLVLRLGDYVEYTEPYEKGKLSGDKTWYDSQGNIMMIETHVDGKINGEQITYYPNAKVRSIVYYKNNRITGIEWYNQDGKKIYKDIFKNGNGSWKSFFDKGNVHEEGEYINHARHGVWRMYNEKGQLTETRTYRNGAIVGRSWN
ncbi:MAG: toxin-antitoxin system YwqK family antitoxin [Fusobacteriaceae bacterium]